GGGAGTAPAGVAARLPRGGGGGPGRGLVGVRPRELVHQRDPAPVGAPAGRGGGGQFGAPAGAAQLGHGTGDRRPDPARSPDRAAGVRPRVDGGRGAGRSALGERPGAGPAGGGRPGGPVGAGPGGGARRRTPARPGSAGAGTVAGADGRSLRQYKATA